jgi:hypothetical protein
MLRFRAVGREPRGGDAGAGSPGRAHGVPPGPGGAPSILPAAALASALTVHD